MNNVRMAVLGLGHAGSRYAGFLADGKIRGAVLSAVCTRDREKLKPYGSAIATFTNVTDLLAAQAADALIIATPHADHVAAGIAALEAGWHVLVEKPMASRLDEGRKLIAAYHGRTRQVLSVMFNLRVVPVYREISRLVHAGELGAVRRVHWTFTDWYRTEAYFESSWRGTWVGEGGGLLINQVIHHLDLLQWWLGKPAAVMARAEWGKYHRIEVEDEVVAWWHFDHGLTVSLALSTGEAPGLNHLEIVGDKGSLVLDGSKLVWHRLAVPLAFHIATCSAPDEKPEYHSKTLRVATLSSSHAAFIQNFVNAIQHGEPPVVPAEEGLISLEIANAMQLSALTRSEITLPLDVKAFERAIEAVIERKHHP